ncbi:E3 ubiquitin-protein ligase [Forsythia ovata]|uniref:E3 ubiquitin-protein ligase n=1 Tax=Forsythia ovata TaxID=205694 RepID=A0ABD1RIE0_9LAMI
MGFFSPQFDGPAYELQSEENIIYLGDASQPYISEAGLPSNLYSNRKEDTLVKSDRVCSHSVLHAYKKSNLQMLTEDDETISTSAKEDKNLHSKYQDGTCEPVSVNGVLCGSCNSMLFQPVVLNCGHGSPEGSKEKLCISSSSGEDPLPRWKPGSNVHIGYGCDSCGMYPIIGDRYRCKECMEEIGYDLCEDCYTTRSKLPGRFNQKHTPEHGFEMIKSNTTCNIMLRLLRGQLEEVAAASNAFSDAVEDLANVFSSLSNTTLQDAENGLDATNTSTDTEEN